MEDLFSDFGFSGSLGVWYRGLLWFLFRSFCLLWGQIKARVFKVGLRFISYHVLQVIFSSALRKDCADFRGVDSARRFQGT